MTSRTWIKIYCEKWLEGTIRNESPELRGIWVDLLALAGNMNYGDSGEIKLVNSIGIPDETIAKMLKISPVLWQKNKKILIESGRIKQKDNNVLKISKWSKYQSEYDRTKKYRRKSTTDATKNGTPQSTNEKKNKKKKKEIYKESALEILSYLNKKTNRNWEKIEEIAARLKDGHSKGECIKLIDNKLQDPFFKETPDLYHPSTLFKKGHWDKYFKYEPPKGWS